MNVRYRLARRGAIYLIYNFEFESEITPKYCLLMEDLTPITDTLIIVLTTSNMEYEYEDTTIIAEIKNKGTTLINLYNKFEIPIEILLNEQKSKHLCNLTEEKMAEVNEKLKKLKISNDIWLRMQPNTE
jgi:hypothetical protein